MQKPDPVAESRPAEPTRAQPVAPRPAEPTRAQPILAPAAKPSPPKTVTLGAKPAAARRVETALTGALDADAARSGGHRLVWVGLSVLLVGGIGVGVAILSSRGTPVSSTPTSPDSAAVPAVSTVTTATVTKTDAPAVGEQVYRRLLTGSLFLLTANDRNGTTYLSAGSGFLVHKDRRLVVTNYHVVGDRPVVLAFAPAYDDRHAPVTEPAHYATNAATLGVRARVAFQDSQRDLAVLELDHLPAGLEPLPLADAPAEVGATVYSVGCSGVRLRDFGGSLWRMSTGAVRGRFRGQLRLEGGQSVDAMVLETQKPVNPGDSGGPTVNDRGQVVAVVSSGEADSALVNRDIDVSEVKSVLERYATSVGWVWQPPAVTPPAADPTDVAALIAALRSGEAGARVDAARKLATLGPSARRAVPALLASADGLPPDHQEVWSQALERMGPPVQSDAPVLVTALRSSSPVAREYALQQYGNTMVAPPDALQDVVRALGDPTIDVRLAAVQAIQKFGSDARGQAFVPLLDRIADTEPKMADAAMRLLDGYDPPTSAEQWALRQTLQHAKPVVRRYAASRLVAYTRDPKDATTLWTPVLDDTDTTVRSTAMEGLAKWRTDLRPAIGTLLARVADASPRVRAQAADLLSGCSDDPKAHATLLVMARSDTDMGVRDAAVASLTTMSLTGVDRLPALRLMTTHRSAPARRKAAQAIAALGPAAAPAVDDLVTLLRSPPDDVRTAAARALGAIGEAAAAKAATPLREMILGANPATPAASTPTEPLADRLLRAAVWIHALDALGRPVTRSGVLVDPEARAVLTAAGPVTRASNIVAVFPYREGGRIVTESQYYVDNMARLRSSGHAIDCRVSSHGADTGVAVLTLLSAPPDGSSALPVASTAPAVEQAVHALVATRTESPATSRALWRQVAGRALHVHGPYADPQASRFPGRLIETDLDIGGDSGGPVVNDNGELVGMVAWEGTGQSYVIDIIADRRLPTRQSPETSSSPKPHDAHFAAAAALAKMGDAGRAELVAALRGGLPTPVAGRVCVELAGFGPKAEGHLGELFHLATTQPTLRPAIGDALIRLGGAAVIDKLIESTITGPVVRAGKREEAVPADVRLWAIQTLGRLDRDRLTKEQLDKILSRLERLVRSFERVRENVDAAQTSIVRLKSR